MFYLVWMDFNCLLPAPRNDFEIDGMSVVETEGVGLTGCLALDSEQ